MKKHTIIQIGLIIMTAVLLASCAPKQKIDTIVIYDGTFSEMRIIHRTVKNLVEAHTKVKVEIREEMSSVNSYREMLRGNADMMNSYDGTLLTTFLHLDPGDVPEGISLYDFVNAQAAKAPLPERVRLLDKLGINNTYAIAVTQRIADQYNLSTVSGLVPAANKLVFGAEHEFFTEEGSAKFNPFAAFYGLNFKEVRQLDISLKYQAIDSGNIDVTDTYATDGLNKKYQLKILADDRNFFPEYNGALLVRADLFDRMRTIAPDLEEVLSRLKGIFTDEAMVNLTYAVDVEFKTAEETAQNYLREKGLIL